jgi:hypothetical protein
MWNHLNIDTNNTFQQTCCWHRETQQYIPSRQTTSNRDSTKRTQQTSNIDYQALHREPSQTPKAFDGNAVDQVRPRADGIPNRPRISLSCVMRSATLICAVANPASQQTNVTVPRARQNRNAQQEEKKSIHSRTPRSA